MIEERVFSFLLIFKIEFLLYCGFSYKWKCYNLSKESDVIVIGFVDKERGFW